MPDYLNHGQPNPPLARHAVRRPRGSRRRFVRRPPRSSLSARARAASRRSGRLPPDPSRRVRSQTVELRPTLRVHGVLPRYADVMHRELETHRGGRPILRKAAAGLVLIAVAALVIHVVIGLVLAVFWVFVALAAVVAVLWALKTLVW
jgi:hypothetical protein